MHAKEITLAREIYQVIRDHPTLVSPQERRFIADLMDSKRQKMPLKNGRPWLAKIGRRVLAPSHPALAGYDWTYSDPKHVLHSRDQP